MIPIYIIKISRASERKHTVYYLADVVIKQRRAVRVLTITHDTTIEAWSSEQTKEYIVDQTAEAMRTVMLHEVKYSPVRHWEDASWYYKWDTEIACCLLFPYIEINQDGIRVQRPTNYAWMRLPETLEIMTECPDRRTLQHYQLEDTFTRNLLQTGDMEKATSPNWHPSKKSRSHTIPLHTEITQGIEQAQEQ